MATLSELKARVLRLLADVGTTYSEDLIFDGVRAALEEILPWVPKQSVSVLTGDGSKVEFDLPADLYRVIAVYDEDTGLYLPAASMSALDAPGQDIDANQDWIEFPEGKISFAKPLADSLTATLFYAATWTVPAAGASTIEAPLWIHRSLCLYTCSYVLFATATSMARINQWDVKSVDAGTPDMNPVKDMSNFFYERFLQSMKLVPARMRGSRG